jgi:hypothetical protein
MHTPLKIKIPKLNNLDSAKKYMTYSPNSKDSNYINYTKEQSITNYFKKTNNPNIKKNSNKFFSIDKSHIFGHFNTFSNIKNNNSYNNSILNNKNNINNISLINNNKKILLTSLFNLPDLNKSRNKYSPKSINNSINKKRKTYY